MKFQTYPHDTQNCTMMIESRKWAGQVASHSHTAFLAPPPVSYTADDLIFDWEESDPLVVEKHIELPQHDLIHQQIDYCTTNYSSGILPGSLFSLTSNECPHRSVYVRGGNVHSEKETR